MEHPLEICVETMEDLFNAIDQIQREVEYNFQNEEEKEQADEILSETLQKIGCLIEG